MFVNIAPNLGELNTKPRKHGGGNIFRTSYSKLDRQDCAVAQPYVNLGFIVYDVPAQLLKVNLKRPSCSIRN